MGDDTFMIFVIGSGPAAASCATALASRGIKPIILDAGIELEAESTRNIEAYLKNGDPMSLKSMKSGMTADTKGIPLKLSFGSDFPYREASKRLLITENTSGAVPSFALGGLSNVWGAAMLPYRDADITDWPFSASSLAPHYRAVAQLAKMTASSTGTMDDVFPSFLDSPGALDLNSQGKSLWKDLEISRAALREHGFLYGRGRVAVRTTRGATGGCDYKGLCMYGCPEGHIYNSRDTIRQLDHEGKVDYRKNIVVNKILETANGIEIECSDRVTGAVLRFTGSKVFLAAGVIPSARILMQSMNLEGRKIVMKDSQYFLFPLLRLKGEPGVAKEASNTLSQIFIELVEGSGLDRSSHLQVYGYNEMIGQALRSTLGIAGRLLPSLPLFLEERLLIVQGYLHSDLSGTIEAWLENGQVGDSPMHLRAVKNPVTRRHIGQVLRKVMLQAHRLKALPLFPMLQVAPPGRGFHTGGTFPMSNHPQDLQTDIWGRPVGFKNLHVVDSSVLPSIPATTITFSVMANAHRIASECELSVTSSRP
jgi:choline dehydrogenase-like flavoprotein